MNPPPSRDRIEEYCQLYLWARHDLNPFGESEYTRFCELQSILLEYIEQKCKDSIRLLHQTNKIKVIVESSFDLYNHQTKATKILRKRNGSKVNYPGSSPTYCVTRSAIGQLTSEQPVKVHKRSHSNFKINFPSFLFKATEHSQPRIVVPSTSTTVTTLTTISASLSSPSSLQRTSVQQSRPTRVKVLSRTGQGSSSSGGGSGLNLKRLSHSAHRKKHGLLVSPPDNETSTILQSNDPSHVFTNDIIGELDSNADLLLVSKGDINGTSILRRRDSCQSDGSQTALIDLEPVIASPKSSIQSSRPIIKHTDSYNQPDSRSSIRYNKGMENEGVNC
ncbi:unnamed protein product [Heterobilharzia americana]|nr:unnamed protein product [Heterobilharzia americana]